MRQQTYSILLPYASTSEGREHQTKDIKVIHAAMKEADLKPFKGNGVITLEDKRQVLAKDVAQVLESTIVIFDANCYEATKHYGLSPFLYYFLGVRHATGNQTIIVTKTDHHLPAVFHQHHTLIYEESNEWEQIEEFKQQLLSVAQAIITQEDDKKPDNPVQMHISQTMQQIKQQQYDQVTAMQQAAQEQITRLQAKLDEYEQLLQQQQQMAARQQVAQEQIDRLQAKLNEYEKLLQRQQQMAGQRPSTTPQPIQFRSLGKKKE